MRYFKAFENTAMAYILRLKYHACEQGPIYVPGVRNIFLLIKLKVFPRKLRNILVKLEQSATVSQ